MAPLSLFTVALGLPASWEVVDVAFDPKSGQVDFHRAFASGTRFACPHCGAERQPVHDTLERDWCHLNFFQFQAYSPCQGASCALRDLRLDYPQVVAPWARSNSGFSLRMEALLVTLCQAMAVSQVAHLRLASATGASGAPSIITSIRRTLKRTSRPSPRLVSTRPPRGVDTIT